MQYKWERGTLASSDDLARNFYEWSSEQIPLTSHILYKKIGITYCTLFFVGYINTVRSVLKVKLGCKKCKVRAT